MASFPGLCKPVGPAEEENGELDGSLQQMLKAIADERNRLNSRQEISGLGESDPQWTWRYLWELVAACLPLYIRFISGIGQPVRVHVNLLIALYVPLFVVPFIFVPLCFQLSAPQTVCRAVPMVLRDFNYGPHFVLKLRISFYCPAVWILCSKVTGKRKVKFIIEVYKTRYCKVRLI